MVKMLQSAACNNCVSCIRALNAMLLIYLLPAVGLTPGGGNTVHIYTKSHRTTKLTNLVGRLSGIRTQIGQTKINDEISA
jgi:hypothetical protein